MARRLAAMRCKTATKLRGPLDAERRRALHQQVPRWRMGRKTLSRSWAFVDFRHAWRRAGAIARLAEREQHHPDIHLERYKRLRIRLTTHKAGGLTRNDFILAAKIDELDPQRGGGNGGKG